MKNIRLFSLLILIVLCLVACAPAAPTTAPTEAATEAATDAPATEDATEAATDDATEVATEVPTEAVEVAPIKFALLPSTEMLPFFVAQAQGYFEAEGIAVEPIPVSSAPERDQLMQAGEIDGMVGELPSTMAFNREEILVKSIYVTRRPTEGHALFSVVVGPGSTIASVEDLAGVPIGLSQNTVNEYTTFTMLTEAGLAPEDFATESVPAIPERFQLLMSGQLKAATLVEPLTTAAVAAGGKVIVDDSALGEYVSPIITFSVGTLENNEEGVRRFLRAWKHAAEDINADPDAFRDVLLANVQLPEGLGEIYSIPDNWGTGDVASEASWDRVLGWLTEKGLFEGDVSYSDSVTEEYLP
jgi:NitT/TauT family transport system substrate-binding protein